jgi:hypothetical protein
MGKMELQVFTAQKLSCGILIPVPSVIILLPPQDRTRNAKIRETTKDLKNLKETLPTRFPLGGKGGQQPQNYQHRRSTPSTPVSCKPPHPQITNRTIIHHPVANHPVLIADHVATQDSATADAHSASFNTRTHT